MIKILNIGLLSIALCKVIAFNLLCFIFDSINGIHVVLAPHTLLEIVSGIDKVVIPSRIKHVSKAL